MFLLNSNKTGLGTVLGLLLLGLSLYPTCGRPTFQDEDEDMVADEDHEEEEENQVDEQDEDDSDNGDDGEKENDINTTQPTGTPSPEKCAGQKFDVKLMELCVNSGGEAQRKIQEGDRGGALKGSADGGATPPAVGKDELDN